MSTEKTPTDPLLDDDQSSPEEVIETPEDKTESVEEPTIIPAPQVEPGIEEAETIAETAPEPIAEPEAEPEAVPEKQPESEVKAAEVKPKTTPALNQVDEIAMTKKKLTEGPQTQFLVPLAEGEAAGAVEVVTINGYKTKVPKGELATIPVNVAKIIAEKYKIGMTAGLSSRIDRDNKVTDALS